MLAAQAPDDGDGADAASMTTASSGSGARMGAASAASGAGAGADAPIRVFVRLRPSSAVSAGLEVDGDTVLRVRAAGGEAGSAAAALAGGRATAAAAAAAAAAAHAFRFERVFGMSASQEAVFDAVARDAVDAVLSGVNATVFAYGQTGSGKTFTVTGGAERYADRGLIPRALSRLFASFRSAAGGAAGGGGGGGAGAGAELRAWVSYLELYNESGYDLLDPSQESKALEALPRVTLQEDEAGAVHLRGLSQHGVGSEEEALNLLFLGDTNRAIAETPMNLASSRSHCIFTVVVEARVPAAAAAPPGGDAGGGAAAVAVAVRRAKLHLVDLAGSERVHKTNAAGTQLREAAHINRSLHFLELVIVALHEARRGVRTHIPYRNSLLTSVLRDSLGGNCRTAMIATLNPEEEHAGETLSTCRFAQRVALIHNAAVVNEEVDPAERARALAARVRSLEAELALVRGGGGGSGGTALPLDEQARSDIDAAAAAWLAAPGDDDDAGADLALGELTLPRLRYALHALRALARGAAAAPRDDQFAAAAALAAARAEAARLREQLRACEARLADLTALADEQRAATLRLPDGSAVARGILTDRLAALAVFTAAHPRTEACNANKRELKIKFAAAKDCAERVNRARDGAARAKADIERQRLARAMAGIARRDGGSGGGEDGGDDGEEEEAPLKAALDMHKLAYKAAYAELRALKTEIEHTQALAESGLARIRADGDAWFAREAAAAGFEPPRSVVAAEAPPAPTPPPPPRLPPPATPPLLTGHAAADEDIRAFYRVKEELARRCSVSGGSAPSTR